ncbi:MAG: glycosyl hydrolase [Luteolibacter sp.]
MVTRRSFLSGIAATLAAGNTYAATSEISKKKGWCGGNAGHHKKFGVSWYYNWTPNKGSSDAEFVPLIKKKWDMGKKPFDKIRGYENVSHILGFNEPEREKQSNISVQDAIKLWPKITALADQKNLRVGSPASTADAAGMAWTARFMDQIDKKNLRVDFLTLHWYGTPNSDHFEKYIDNMEKKYSLPMWITEFNGWSGSEADNYKFLKDALRYLERNRDVERYAYYNPKGKPHSLLKNDGSLTRMGELYRDAGT